MSERFWNLLAKSGPWALLAGLLVWVLIADVRADNRDMKEQHAAIVVEQQNLARGILKLADKSGETQMLQEKVLMVMRTMCIQGAVSAADRRECMREQ